LLAAAARVLSARGIDHAVIGAAALAAHGVARATADLDLLVTDPACLDEALWAPLRAGGASVEIRRGDAADPLAGVLRIREKGDAALDVIVGRGGWQREVLRRALRTRVADSDVPTVRAADLVLLKLYAGGPQDAWDIDQLLDAQPGLAPEVEAGLAALPADCAALWQRILEQRRPRPG
jgi:hypothetical protein